METTKCSCLFTKIDEDDEIKSLIRNVYITYGGFKHSLLTLKNGFNYYIDLMLLSESVYSLNIKEDRVKKNFMFYIKYSNESTIVNLIKNNKKCFINTFKELKNINKVDINIFSKMDEILLSKTGSSKKDIGVYRRNQSYVMKMGLVGKTIDFVPIKKNYIKSSIISIVDSINNSPYEYLVNIALTHFRILTVHPFSEGGGRISRCMVPLLFSYYLKEEPILMISEALEMNKSLYFKVLNGAREGNAREYVIFFLKMLSLQCSLNINRIDKINKVYEEDYKKCLDNISGSLIKSFYPYLANKIVLSIGDVTKDLNMHINSVNKLIKRLLELGIISKSKEPNTTRVTYRYDNMYNIFIK
ncbi:MAG: Fic family protein [Bacilli bacterium]